MSNAAIFTLSLHDALPISRDERVVGIETKRFPDAPFVPRLNKPGGSFAEGDRKSTRLNSSHLVISYAVFCLKKKMKYEKEKLIMRKVFCSFVKYLHVR